MLIGMLPPGWGSIAGVNDPQRLAISRIKVYAGFQRTLEFLQVNA
jgi:hypothetical protein